MSSIRRTGQEGLMLWLQSRTSGYKGVNIVDFTRSWENGLAFCALIHSFHPDLIPFDTLKPEDKAANLKLAFDTADKLGVPALMDPEDMLMDCGPDKFSVVTYASQYFHKFKDFDNKDGSDEVQIKAPLSPVMSKEDEMLQRRQRLDQERMLAKRCAKCHNGFPNGGTIIDALGKQYHPECFVCFSCNKLFKDNKFVNVDSSPYCPVCAKDKFTSKAIAPVDDANPPCFKCKKACEGDTVNALGHEWHPECFTCTTCNKQFQAGAAKVLNVDGLPYCEQCGRRAFVSRRTVASPTPPGSTGGGSALNKSKSMGAIPKNMEMAGDSPTSKPLLGSGNLSSRLNAFQKQEESPPAKKPELGKLGSGSGIFADRAQRRQEEEQKKKKEEEDKEAKKQEEERQKEEIRKKKEEDKQKKKLEEEEKKRKEQEEKEARKKEEEEMKKRRAEEVKKRKAEEEAKKKREAEEEEARKRDKTDQIKRTRSESSAKKLELEEAKRRADEEQKKKEAEEEEKKQEILRKKREEMKARADEEEKKREESTNKRTSIRFLQRSNTETFVAHNKIADVSSGTTTTIISPSNTPRSGSTTPRDTSSSGTVVHIITPRATSPSPSPSPPSSSATLVPTLTISPSPSPSPTPPSTSSPAAEKVIKMQSHYKIPCTAADVMCPFSGATDSALQAHLSSCSFYILRPILLKLKQSNEDLQKKVEQLQSQQEKDHELIASLQKSLSK